MADTGENIEHGSTAGHGVTSAIGGEQGQVVMMRQVNQGVVDAFFITQAVPLNFDVNAVGTEGAGEPCEDGIRSAVVKAPLVSSSRRKETLTCFCERRWSLLT